MPDATEVVLLLLALVVVPLSGYVVGKRRGIHDAWVAFIPIVGFTIVILWSIGRSGWLTVIEFIPIIGFIWWIWLAVTVPRAHGRTRWWALALFLLPVIGFCWYAFTLADVSRSEGSVAQSI